MDFEKVEYDYSFLLTLGLPFAVTIVLTVVLVFWAAASTGKKPAILAILSLVVFGGGIAGSHFFHVNHAENIKKDNIAAITANIKQKYDVEEVIIEKGFSSASSGIQDINLVVDNNGVKQEYVFWIEQDEETSEPFIYDPAIPGGSELPDDQQVSASDLLKK